MSEETMSFEAHSYQMERDRQSQAAQLELARQATKQARWKAMGTSLSTLFGSAAAAAAVVGLAWIIWQSSAGPSAKEEIEEQGRSECIQAGGTWLGGHDTTEGSCVMPGSSTK